MRHSHLFLFLAIVLLSVGCAKKDKGMRFPRVPKARRTLYTQQAAMSLYGYQPVRALQILDSAVLVGNMSEFRAEKLRAKIYSASLMHDQLDSLLGGAPGVRLDSAQAIGERILQHDSVKNNLKEKLDVLEMLAHTARMQDDTVQWMTRSREYVDVCHQLGPAQETNALRAEAEIGAALFYLGQQEQGLAKLDSAIQCLSPDPVLKGEDAFRFNELDALIIALKRKIVLLSSQDKTVEMLPLARQIIERLDDYEQHPDAYHDGSSREPKDSVKRSDYIRFYRTQAQNFITVAYASLGEMSNVMEAYNKLELIVREATAREHVASYHALEQQMLAERRHLRTRRSNTIAISVGILAFLAIVFAVVLTFKNRIINKKNVLLAQQIAEAVYYKNMFWEEKFAQPLTEPVSDLNTLTDEQLFQYVSDAIVHDKLFLDPNFGRQTVMDHYHLSKERIGAIFSKGSDHAKLASYIQQLRLDYATRLLVNQPDKSIVEIAEECGFRSHTYFTSRFRLKYGITPSEFRTIHKSA